MQKRLCNVNNRRKAKLTEEEREISDKVVDGS